jgi:hypothetical protein
MILGHHYWDEIEKIEERISENSLLLRDIQDPTATIVIKKLLNKKASRRMTLEDFTVVRINNSNWFILFTDINM